MERFADQINLILGLCRKWFSDNKFAKYTAIWKEMKEAATLPPKVAQLAGLLKVDAQHLLLALN